MNNDFEQFIKDSISIFVTNYLHNNDLKSTKENEAHAKVIIETFIKLIENSYKVCKRCDYKSLKSNIIVTGDDNILFKYDESDLVQLEKDINIFEKSFCGNSIKYTIGMKMLHDMFMENKSSSS